MRTLTSVQSATHCELAASLELTASDVSTTWVFSGDNIVSISPLTQKIDFTGGFGELSTYDVTLSTSLDWIKTYISIISNAKVPIDTRPQRSGFQGLQINLDAFLVGRFSVINEEIGSSGFVIILNAE